MATVRNWFGGHLWGKVVAIVTFISLIVGIVAGLNAIYEHYSHKSDGAASRVTMDIADGTAVYRCTWVGGTAPNEDGKQLWVAVDTNGSYLWQLTEPKAGDRWSAKLYIGGDKPKPNQQYELRAFYIANDQSRFMAGIRPFGEDDDPGYYLTSGPPPDASKETTRTVTRNAGPDRSCK